MKLAKAAAQQLKGVIIEYDVLCSSLLGKSEIEMRCNVAAEKKHQEIKEHLSPSLFDPKSIKSMLVSDVRRLLKDLNEDSTGKPWAAKERLQNTLQGLPNQILNRITGFDEQEKNASVKNDTISASLAPARMKQQNHEVKKLNMGLQLKRGEQESSLRDKYMDKLNQLKEKKQQESVARHEEAENGTTSEGLSTWLVNDGANEVLSYSDLRGFFKAIIPPRNPLQNDEYLQFQKEMEGHFDLFVSIDELEEFRDSKPIINICQHLDLQPSDMIVLARHAHTLKAAKDAGTHVCHYMPEDKAIPNHTAHYHLTHLCDYQHLIEDYNGISYRDKITLGSIKF